jgi:hypothetical protein
MTPSAQMRCEWCDKAVATEVIVRDRPTAAGGMDRARTLTCGGCGDIVYAQVSRIADVTAVYRLTISTFVPSSEEVA